MAQIIQRRPALQFILKTLFHFVVFPLLTYLCGYCGVGQEPFIYNES